MAEIKVQTVKGDGGWEFQVTVIEGQSQSSHRVTMSTSTYDQLTGGTVSPEECVRKSFEFLLEREPKESILSRFDITKISSYFPDFEQTFKQKIGR